MTRQPGSIRCQADPALLVERIHRLLAGTTATSARVIIGIAGAPGAGKSTLAQQVVSQFGPDAVLVTMDGFHLAQRVIDDLGLAGVKGAPETFDAAGYLALLQRLESGAGSDTIVYAPEFRRAIEEPVAGAVPVPPTARVVVTEGNYLLLDTSPWDQIRALLTEVWFLDPPASLRVDRLVARHVQFGRAPAEARERAVHGTDGRNAELVDAARRNADVILTP